MNPRHSATKRRRCGSGLMPPRRLSSPIGATGGDSSNGSSSSFSCHDGSARKRACFRSPCSPLNQPLAAQASRSRSGRGGWAGRGRQTPSSIRTLPAQVVVTPPSCLLSSLSGDFPSLGGSDSAQSRQNQARAPGNQSAAMSMNCSFDSVLDSQVFGLVDELEELNRQPADAPAEPCQQQQAGPAQLAEPVPTSAQQQKHGDAVVQQLFTPEVTSDSARGSARHGAGEGRVHGRGSDSAPRAPGASVRPHLLQAGLKALQSPEPVPPGSVSCGAAKRTTNAAANSAGTAANPPTAAGPPAAAVEAAAVAASPATPGAVVEEMSEELSLSSWGIPAGVVAQYRAAGVSHLFAWQAECLVRRDVLAGRNLVYSAPTSGGKSIVAELLLLKRVLETRRRAILILPFVSVAREKAAHLQRVLGDVGVRVGAFVGSDGPRGGFACVDVAVCTIERANSLVNRLLEEGRVGELCMMIVDELHMLGDPHRGYLLELLLTKVQFVSASSRRQRHGDGGGNAASSSSGGAAAAALPAIQIVGMSATLPNLATVARWLDAELYCTDFRPVPLAQYIKAGDVVYDTALRQVRSLAGRTIKGDDDSIFLLCREALADGHGVLIFCPTKGHCEKLALALAEMAGRLCPAPSGEERAALAAVADALRATPVGLDAVLARTLPFAIAFHHAGLAMEERDVLEAAFRRQSVRLLVATSTLASGVNLPARRVIIRTPHFHGRLLDALAYHQMAGRAGRKGLDDRGESFLICKAGERARVHALLTAPLAPVRSCLAAGRGGSGGESEEGRAAGMQRALLEIVVSRVARTHADILRYAGDTLLAAEELESQASSQSSGQSSGSGSGSSGKTTPKRRSLSGKARRASGARRLSASASASGSLLKTVQTALAFLLDNEFIAVRQDESAPPPTGSAATASALVADADAERSYYSTQLGNATLSSSLSPGEALEVFGELQRAQRCFVLENELHTVYQVTPIYLQAQWPGLDWYRFLALYGKLPADLQRVGDLVGVEEAFLVNAVHGGGARRAKSARAKRQQLVHRRFYLAMALHDLVHEVPLADVADKYAASRGLLQSLQQAAATFAGMVTAFCGGLGWHNLQLLLDQFQGRLIFGVERQLVGMLQISLLDAATARALYNSNLRSVQALAAADVAAIEAVLRQCSPFRSAKHGGGDDGDKATDDVAVAARRCRGRHSRRGFHYDLDDAKAAAIIRREAAALVQKGGGGLGGAEPSAFPAAALMPPPPPPPLHTRVDPSERRDEDGTPATMATLTSGRSERDGRDRSRAPVTQPPAAEESVGILPPVSAVHAPTTTRGKSHAARQDTVPPVDSDLHGSDGETPAAAAVRSPLLRGPTAPGVMRPSRTFQENAAQREPSPAPHRGLVPDAAATAAALATPVDNGLAAEYAPEELEALADAMEIGAAMSSFSYPLDRRRSEPQPPPFDGFVSASRLLQSPADSATSGARSDACPTSTVSVAPPPAGGTSPGDGREESFPASFRHSKMLCSTPLDSTSELARSRSGAGRTRNGSSTSRRVAASCRRQPRAARGGDDSAAACSPQLVSASMMMADGAGPAYDQSQDLFADTGEQDDDVDQRSMAREDSEGFSVDVLPSERAVTPVTPPAGRGPPQASRKEAVHDSAGDLPLPGNLTNDFLPAEQAVPANAAADHSASNLPVPDSDFLCSSSLFEDLFADDALDDSLLREASQSLSLTPGAGEKNFCVIDVCGHRRLLRTFLREWSQQECFAVALACRSGPAEAAARPTVSLPSAATAAAAAAAAAMGTALFDTDVTALCPAVDAGATLCGVSVCWQPSEIYYLSLENAGDDDGDGGAAAGATAATAAASAGGGGATASAGGGGGDGGGGADTDAVSASERLAVVERLLCDARRAGLLYAFDMKALCRQLSASLRLLLDGPAVDVRLAAWMLDPDRAPRTLAQLVRDELPQCCARGADSLYYLATTPHRPPRLAAAAAASLALQLVRRLRPPLAAEGLWAALRATEGPAALCFARMELCGLGADPAECNRQQLVLQRRLAELEEHAYELAGHSFALTSPADVATVLFHELRLPPDGDASAAAATTTTTTAARVTRSRGRGVGGRGAAQRLQRHSTNKEVLARLSRLHALPDVLLEWRRVNGALAKVVFPLRQELRAHRGLAMARVRCLVQLHTATGRIALTEPNVQNVPKRFSIAVDDGDDDDSGGDGVGAGDRSAIRPTAQPSSAVVMRDFFVPAAGHVLVAADYSQLELRLLAHLSADPKLCAILRRTDADVFRSMASDWLGVAVATVTAEQRQQAKQVCYGVLYGIGAKGLAAQLGVDADAASRFTASFRRTYAAVARYTDDMVRRCRAQGFVATIGGRRRYLPNINSASPAARAQAERRAVNTGIQGSAADLVKTAMVGIDAALVRRHGRRAVFGCHHAGGGGAGGGAGGAGGTGCEVRDVAAFLVLQLHDELMYEVRRDLCDEVGALVRREMEGALALSVPMPVKLKRGPSWGQLQDWAPALPRAL